MSQEQGVDLDSRDPNNINDSVNVSYEDVLAEGPAFTSIDCVWKNSYACFNCSKNCCYKFLTTLCGICCALLWGCEFAIAAFDSIWCITPCFRLCTIYLGCSQKFVTSCLMCFLGPVCETCGLFFSKVQVTNK